MKKHLLFLLCMIFFSSGFAQVYPSKYFVEFTDKDNSPYSIENPEEYLSPRAIERRERYDIPIDEHDLPVNPQYLEAVENIGVELLNVTKWLNGVVVYTDDPTKIDQIMILSFVKDVRANKPLPASPEKLTWDDDSFSLNKPFGMEETSRPLVPSAYKSSNRTSTFDYGASFNQIDMIGGVQMHDNGYQGQGMVIAILDGGFSSADEMEAFDSLFMTGRILGTRDFVSGGTYVYHGATHGTSVLSTIGAYLPGQIIGTAPKASFYLIRTEDTGSEYIIEEYNWASGAEYADSVGADVINSSLSYKTFDDPAQDHTYQQMDGNTAPSTIAADMAMSRGMIVVNSAGNDGGSFTWPYIGAPADGDSVFSIGAVDADGEYAYFSSIGPTADGRLKPNVTAQGSGTVLASTYGGTYTGSGTSFSSPIIAGMTACLWQVDRSRRNMDILNSIQMSSSLASDPDYEMGYGIPNYAMATIILSGFNPDLVSNPNEIEVFPNPFSDRINIVYNSQDTQSVSVRIFDIAGKLVFERRDIRRKYGLNYFAANHLQDLQKGMYILKIQAEGNIATKKLLKVD